MNPKAKPFSFNASATAFRPSQVAAPPQQPAAAASWEDYDRSAPYNPAPQQRAPAAAAAPAARPPARNSGFNDANLVPLKKDKNADMFGKDTGKKSHIQVIERPSPAASPSPSTPTTSTTTPTAATAAATPATPTTTAASTAAAAAADTSSAAAAAEANDDEDDSTTTTAAAPAAAATAKPTPSPAPPAAEAQQQQQQQQQQQTSTTATAAPAVRVLTEREKQIEANRAKPMGGFVPTKEMLTYKVHDEREHLNIVFIGHVDAGKSTISGQILLLTGQVDERTIAKYEKEAKDKGRDSWYLAYIMDTNEEERAKGKTVEVGRAHFTTNTKRYTLLDAPGHKNYVPNMIGGAAQADVGVLVISARKSEFEAGFERGGQTREHAMLAKTLGISRLVVLVNKMDEATVKWSKTRYDEIENKLTPFLRKWGYAQKDITYVPVSGYTGANLKVAVTADVCPWWEPRISFLELLDKLEPIPRQSNAAVRIPVVARYKDMGALHILGKLESGTLFKGQKLMMMPTSTEVEVTGLAVDEKECNIARPGENLVVRVKGCEEEDVHPGFVLSPVESPAKKTMEFDAQVMMLELLEHKPLLTAGYLAILHIHSLSIECQVTKLLSEIDPKTGKPAKRRPKFLKNGSSGTIRITVEETVVVEPFTDFAQLGRFTLRDEGRTIAIGKVLSINEKTA